MRSLPQRWIFLQQYRIGTTPSYRVVSCYYLCIFKQTRLNNGYVVQFCNQYLDRLYACLDANLSNNFHYEKNSSYNLLHVSVE